MSGRVTIRLSLVTTALTIRQPRAFKERGHRQTLAAGENHRDFKNDHLGQFS